MQDLLDAFSNQVRMEQDLSVRTMTASSEWPRLSASLRGNPATHSRAASLDERRGEDNLVSAELARLEVVEQTLRGTSTHFVAGQGHGRERRIDILGKIEVVEADDRKLLGHGAPQPLGGLDRSQCQDVIGANDSGDRRILPQSVLHHVARALDALALHLPDLAPGMLGHSHGRLISRHALLDGWPGSVGCQEADSLMALGLKECHGLSGAPAVVRQDAGCCVGRRPLLDEDEGTATLFEFLHVLLATHLRPGEMDNCAVEAPLVDEPSKRAPGLVRLETLHKETVI